MPEGDTVRRLADRISDRFVGECVQRCTARHPGIVQLDLSGQRLRRVEALGKHLLLYFDEVTVHGHLRMDGRWIVGPRATEPLWRRRLELQLETGWLTALDMPILQAIRPGDESKVIGHLGPDLCGPTPPDLDEIVARMTAQPGQPLAAALLDQRNVAGFGNLYAVEVPFICGVSPFQPVGTITTLRWLVAVGAALIRTNAQRGPQNTTGRRMHTSQHWVYGRARSSCPVCPARVHTAEAHATPWRRVTFWCPVCQPGVDRVTVDVERSRRLLALHPAIRLLADVQPAPAQVTSATAFGLHHDTKQE